MVSKELVTIDGDADDDDADAEDEEGEGRSSLTDRPIDQSAEYWRVSVA